jgi:hypothetical protein
LSGNARAPRAATAGSDSPDAACRACHSLAVLLLKLSLVAQPADVLLLLLLLLSRHAAPEMDGSSQTGRSQDGGSPICSAKSEHTVIC